MNSMTFQEYLELIRGSPEIFQTAHQRAYNAIIKKGFRVVKGAEDERLARVLGLRPDDKVTLYNAFSDFYGLEREIEQIVGYLRAASLGGQASRQALFLTGPPSSGKSDIARKIYWAMDGAEVYCLEGCPIREEPLNAIPRDKRAEWEDILKTKFHTSRDLCQFCRQRLVKEFGGDHTKFRVVKDQISVADGRYFVSVNPTDITTYDKSKYLGSVILGRDESDPTAYEYNGFCHRINGGVGECVEFGKNHKDVHDLMLEVIESKQIESPAGRGPKIFIDAVLVVHSNVPDFEKLAKDTSNAALMSRLFEIRVPHVVRLTEEIKIIDKLSPHPYHLAPGTMEMLGRIAVLSRLSNKDDADKSIRMSIYDGSFIADDNQSLGKIREDFPEDGQSGCDNRKAAEILERALGLVPPDEPLCVDPISILKIAEKMPGISPEDIAIARTHYMEFLDKHLASMVDDCQQLCEVRYDQYLKLLDRIKQGFKPDEAEVELLNTVEQNIEEKDKEQLRKIISETPDFNAADDVIKRGVKAYVLEAIVKPKLKQIIMEMNSLSDSTDRNWQIIFESHFKALDYCPQCLKRIARWRLEN